VRLVGGGGGAFPSPGPVGLLLYGGGLEGGIEDRFRGGVKRASAWALVRFEGDSGYLHPPFEPLRFHCFVTQAFDIQLFLWHVSSLWSCLRQQVHGSLPWGFVIVNLTRYPSEAVY